MRLWYGKANDFYNCGKAITLYVRITVNKFKVKHNVAEDHELFMRLNVCKGGRICVGCRFANFIKSLC